MTKVILIGLDGFRPEMMDETLTPHLWALARKGVLFSHHRSVFPSETYVNVASIVTGTTPGAHGIVANAFLDARMGLDEPWHGARADLVEAAIAAYGGTLMTAPTLGDRLARAGKSLWVLSGNSAGSALQKHPAVGKCPGHVLLAGSDWRVSVPTERAARIADRLGTPPKPVPMADRMDIQSYLVDAFFLLASESALPDATMLWFGEPDAAYHAFGIGAPETRKVLAAIDGELGRIVDWWESHPEHDRIQLIVTSDHGHITQTERVDTHAVLAEAGFRVDRHLQNGADLALVPGYSGNLSVRGGDAGLFAAAAEALMACPDVGHVFTSGGNGIEGGVPGTFGQSIVRSGHDRSPDIFFTLRADDETDAYGLVGTCRFDNALPTGVGYHGGLHRSEMQPLLIAAGSAFAGARVTTAPSSVIDILPTILTLLDEDVDGVQGRVLVEAFPPSDPSAVGEARVLSVSHGPYMQMLHVTDFEGRRYLDYGLRVR